MTSDYILRLHPRMCSGRKLWADKRIHLAQSTNRSPKFQMHATFQLWSDLKRKDAYNADLFTGAVSVHPPMPHPHTNNTRLVSVSSAILEKKASTVAPNSRWQSILVGKSRREGMEAAVTSHPHSRAERGWWMHACWLRSTNLLLFNKVQDPNAKNGTHC